MAFRDLFPKVGCSSLPTIAALKPSDPARFDTLCGSIRVDGFYQTNDEIKGTNAERRNLRQQARELAELKL